MRAIALHTASTTPDATPIAASDRSTSRSGFHAAACHGDSALPMCANGAQAACGCVAKAVASSSRPRAITRPHLAIGPSPSALTAVASAMPKWNTVRSRNSRPATPGCHMINPRLAAIRSRYPEKPEARATKPTRRSSFAATVQSAAPCGMPNASRAITKGHAAAVVVRCVSSQPNAAAEASTVQGHARGLERNRPASAAGSPNPEGLESWSAVGGARFNLRSSDVRRARRGSSRPGSRPGRRTPC